MCACCKQDSGDYKESQLKARSSQGMCSQDSQVRIGQVRRDQARTGQVKSGQVKSGEVKLGQVPRFKSGLGNMAR